MTTAVQETTQDQHQTPDEMAAAPAPTALVRSVQDGSARIRSPFESRNAFDEMIPIAKALAQSTVVPDAYRNKAANCMIALDLAQRIRGVGVLQVMQNLHIINGRPGWSSAFLGASVNTCGRFSPLRYEEQGEIGRPGWRCRAKARELSTGDVLYGTWITWEMAVGEGWVVRKDSKWKTMPEQMIRYRAQAFWTRSFAPELLLGMHTADEIEDIVEARVVTVETDELNKVFQERAAEKEGAAALETKALETPAEPKKEISDEELRREDREVMEADSKGQGRMI